ncbi:hypothetical protein, partial [Kitasatospora sp. NPDC001175]
RSARLLAALDSLSETDPQGPGMLAGHTGHPGLGVLWISAAVTSAGPTTCPGVPALLIGMSDRSLSLRQRMVLAGVRLQTDPG